MIDEKYVPTNSELYKKQQRQLLSQNEQVDPRKIEMLAAVKIITKAEAAEIKKGLLEIGETIAAGKFKFDKSQEDIHMAIESALIKKIGEAGKKLHTGRSRNDRCVPPKRSR